MRRQLRRPRHARRKKQIPDQLHQQKLCTRVAQHRRPPRQRERRNQIHNRERRQARQHSRHQRLLIPSHHHHQRNPHRLLPRPRLGEHRRLRQRQPHPQPHPHQRRARQKWKPPSPRQKLRPRQHPRQQQKHHARREQSRGRPQLRKHPVPRPRLRGRVFDSQQQRPAPLPAQPHPLPKPARGQQHRRRHPNRGPGRQHPNRHRRHAHRHQRNHQRLLPPNPIPKVPKQSGPNWPSNKRNGKRSERSQPCRHWIGLGKEQRRKHQHRGRGINVEVEELNRRPNQRSQQHLPRRVFLFETQWTSAHARIAPSLSEMLCHPERSAATALPSDAKNSIRAESNGPPEAQPRHTGPSSWAKGNRSRSGRQNLERITGPCKPG